MAKPEEDDEAARGKVRELIREIGAATFVTQDAEGQLRGRPMQHVGLDDDGRTLWFFTSAASPKVAEIGHDGRVLLAYGDPRQRHFCVLRGQARIERDSERQQALWSEAQRVWYPEGPTSPDLALIAVALEAAEYWDSVSALKLFTLGYAGAVLTGRPAAAGDVGRVGFPD